MPAHSLAKLTARSEDARDAVSFRERLGAFTHTQSVSARIKARSFFAHAILVGAENPLRSLVQFLTVELKQLYSQCSLLAC